MSFPRYPAYKDSRVDWLGPIPATWNVCALKRIASLQSGESITSEQIEADGTYPVYGGNGLRGYCEAHTHDGEFALIGRQGALCGNINYARGKFWASEHAVVVTPKLPVATQWLGELLRAMNLNQYSVSAAQPGLSVEIVGNLGIPVPSREEQNGIAAFLDRETAKIDALVAEQEQLITLLKEKRQAVISHAVTKGLDPSVPMKDSGVECFGKIPEHWTITPIKRIGSICYGIGEPPSYREEGVPLVRATNVDHGVLRSEGLVFVNPEDIPAKRIFWLEPGDIIVVRSGAYTGDSAIIPHGYGDCIAGFDMVLRCSSAKSNFVQFALLSDPLKMGQIDLMRMRAAQPHLNAEELSSVLLALPPTEGEQNAIAGYLNEKTSEFDLLMTEALAAIGLLQERRSALISAAVTGQIDVRGLVEHPAEGFA